ncbi:carboxypeptidase-like regulatory domain-containing protein [Cyclobacterium xiamenense]|uniref:DUF4974 domain-containing protein n=1 Tax=Cyclobacterium xiamenense TaxID=1297121 RepID=UPI0035CEB32A
MKKTIRKHVTHMTKLFSIAFLFQCLTMSFLMARNGNAQVKNIEEVIVSLNLEDVKIERVFRELEKSTGYNFVFTNKEIRDIPSVGVSSDNNSLYNVLLSLAKQTNLTFKQVDYNIHVKRSRNVATGVIEIQSADITVTGTVTDENGEALPGVTVFIPGTSFGTVTDVDGKYSLSVPEGSRLLFSFIGYASKEIEVGNSAILDIILQADVTALDEVVVVGYGTFRKRDMTGSVSSVSSESVSKVPTPNVDQALQGMASGVFVTSVNGSPGAQSTIRVRGGNSINAGNEPLWVVDGFISDRSIVTALDRPMYSQLRC